MKHVYCAIVQSLSEFQTPIWLLTGHLFPFFLINYVRLIAEKSNKMQEQFDKLILAINSDQSST
jgi:hypothetical protein